MSRAETQQRRGRERVTATTERLLHALERIQSGKTVNPDTTGAWTRENLAREAGVDVSVLYRKRNGEDVYADVRAALEYGRVDTRKGTLAAQRGVIASLEAKVLRLQRQVADLSRENERLQKPVLTGK